jgi:predicted MFS family arabinose efflux permease
MDGSSTTDHEPRLYTPAFIALTVAELAYFTVQGLEIPVAPLFAARQLGAGPVGVGLAFGIVSVTALVLRPVAGRATDRYGRRRLMIGGALAYALATLAHVVAPDLVTMIVLRAILGVAEAFFFVASISALADLAPPGRTGEAISINSLALYLGIALGPLLGQALLAAGGFTAAWVGATLLALATALIAWRLPETMQPRPAGAGPTPPAPLLHRAAFGPGAALFTGIAAMAGFLAYAALYAEDIGVTGWGYLLLEFGLIVVATRLVFAKLPDRVPPYRLGAAALALTGTGVAIVALVPAAAGLAAGVAVLAVGVAFTTPAMFAAVLGRVGPHERGSAMATMTIAIDLAFSAGPIALGLIIASAGIPAAYGAAAGLAIVGAAGAAMASRRALRPMAVAEP